MSLLIGNRISSNLISRQAQISGFGVTKKRHFSDCGRLEDYRKAWKVMSNRTDKHKPNYVNSEKDIEARESLNSRMMTDYDAHRNINGINFSSPFSDDTSAQLSNTKSPTNDVSFDLSRMSDFDGDDLQRILEAALKLPRADDSARFKPQQNAVKRSPLKLDMINIIGSSSPKKKLQKTEMFLVPKAHIRNSSTVTPAPPRKKQILDQYPTIQLATQKEFGIDSSKSTSSKTSETAKPVKPIILSSEQEYVLNLARKGKSLFYTGSAGTGKSVLLKSIIKVLREQNEKGKVAVTASTGLAACNIGGITLHSFAGVGLGEGTVDILLKKLRRNKKALNRWGRVKVLVIDEISMIDGVFLDKLNQIAKKVRRSKQPFGGIQLIVCGDFYQLPPVSKSKPLEDPSGMPYNDYKEETQFAFESKAWNEAITCSIILKEVFRQRGDQKFIDMLNDMRNGIVSAEMTEEFERLKRELPTNDGIAPAELFSTRHEVDYANNLRLNSLKGQTQLYRAIDSGSLPLHQRQTVLSNFLAPQKLFLKANAQVMCIKNFDDTLVNGSLGQVVGFMDRDTYMHYSYMREHPDASLQEVQQEADKKISKDKGNGEDMGANELISLDDSIFDFLDEIPEISSELGSELDEQDCLVFNENKNRKMEMIKTLHESSKKLRYPLVRFLLPDGFNTREVLVEPEQWTVEDENETILAKRVQLPLILAWSLSIHKSQGQTLPKVKVDLKRVFERGQAYVALSRAVSRMGLQVLNFSKSRIMTHPKVNKFYEGLSSTENHYGATRLGPYALGHQKKDHLDDRR